LSETEVSGDEEGSREGCLLFFLSFYLHDNRLEGVKVQFGPAIYSVANEQLRPKSFTLGGLTRFGRKPGFGKRERQPWAAFCFFL